MLTIPELNLGSIDAINYKSKEDKEFFSKILYRDSFLEEILRSKKYFLVGEKGTGKTSFAVFLHNTDYNDTLSRIVSLSQTDYRRFISLKEAGKFSISSYVDIWKVILLLLVSDGLHNRMGGSLLRFSKFAKLKEAVDAYYKSAFRPEVDQTLDIIENSQAAAKIFTDVVEVGGSKSTTTEASFPSFQVNLGYLERQFKDAISSLKLDKDFILFIDGIDIRPDQIGYESYIECIRGLSNATWELNTEFFSQIKDTKKQVKVMLCMRPDILDNMSFQNLNAKVHDNGVVLDWITTYEDFRTSPIFKLIAGTIAKQQDCGGLDLYSVWKKYVPWDLDNLRIAEKTDDPFIGLLRYSFYRPRDIIRYLQLMQNYVRQEQAQKAQFERESFFSCQRDHSEYLLGEVKDYLSFYYSSIDFDEVVGFFGNFSGRNEFSWIEFKDAFAQQKERLISKNPSMGELVSSPEDFLQFLFSLNLIGYVEPTVGAGYFIHFSFRDRTPAKLRPRVKLGLRYHVHPGVQRALQVGGEQNSRRRVRT